MIHPLAPFISEELWQWLKCEGETDLINAPYPARDEAWVAPQEEADIQILREVITALRAIRSEMGIDPGKPVELIARGPDNLTRILNRELPHLQRLAKVRAMSYGPEVDKPPHAATAVVNSLELFIPLEGLIDLDVERARLQKRIQEMEGRLSAAEKKLNNPNYVKRAPVEVVTRERDKYADYVERLKKLRENYQALA